MEAGYNSRSCVFSRCASDYFGKIYKIPVVITEHWTGFPRHVLGKFEILKARFAMNKADIILPVSNQLKDAIKSYHIKNKFKVIPNVVNTEIFYPSLQKSNKKTKKCYFSSTFTTKGYHIYYKLYIKSNRKGEILPWILLEMVQIGKNMRD